jgi:hypothetical protein
LLHVGLVLVVDFLRVVEEVLPVLGSVPELLLVGSMLVVDSLRVAEVVLAISGLIPELLLVGSVPKSVVQN